MRKSTRAELQSEEKREGESDKTTPYERIVTAALICIERQGIESSGIRDIAREAGVNSAAINYYFRNKENLIRLAMENSLERTFGEILDALDTMTANGMPLNDALLQAFDAFVADLQRAPRLSYAHLRDALVNQCYDGPAVQRGIEFLRQLEMRLVQKHAHCDRDTLRNLLVQLWSSLMLTALLPQLYEQFVFLDLKDDEQRSRYVRQLFESLFRYLDSLK